MFWQGSFHHGHVKSAVALGSVLLMAGCIQAVPADPEGTLNSVRSGILRAGVSPASDFVEIQGSEPQGSELMLIEDFAEHMNAQIQWTVAGEEQLVEQLEVGQLDLVAGGITSKTPWAEKVGVTRPYRTAIDVKGKKSKTIMLVRPGENAFLAELEYFLDQTQQTP